MLVTKASLPEVQRQKEEEQTFAAELQSLKECLVQKVAVPLLCLFVG